jgi:hypothetical protein
MGMFNITGGKGFHITFDNGWTVSVQFGPANYCDNYDRHIGDDDVQCGKDGSSTAECAVWGRDGKMIEWGDWGDTVGGHMQPEEVLELLAFAAAQ